MPQGDAKNTMTSGGPLWSAFCDLEQPIRNARYAALVLEALSQKFCEGKGGRGPLDCVSYPLTKQDRDVFNYALYHLGGLRDSMRCATHDRIATGVESPTRRFAPAGFSRVRERTRCHHRPCET
jgi:hypothetical protein